MDKEGKSTYSGTAKITLNNAEQAIIAPNVITDGMLHLNFKGNNYSSIELMGMDGRIIRKENISTEKNQMDIDVSSFSKGMYLLRLLSDSNLRCRNSM